MEIWRKPESADWYYESAECVDDVTVDNSPWTNQKSIVFDATKDKDGGRHTDMKILLSAQEVRSLHQGLIRGQN